MDLAHGANRALAQRHVLFRNDQRRIDRLLEPEAIAGRAGAERIVEREQPRLDFGNGEAGDGAGEFFRKQHALMRFVLGFVGAFLGGAAGIKRLVGELGNRDAFGKAQGCFEGVCKAGADIGANHDAVPPPRRCRACTSCRVPEHQQSRRKCHRP